MASAEPNEEPQAVLSESRRRSPELEMVVDDDDDVSEGSTLTLLQKKPVFDGRSLRYPVKVFGRQSTAWGAVVTPQPFLGSFAPFPYGSASVPSSWEPIKRDPVYLSVPPLHNSDVPEQEYDSPVDGTNESIIPSSRVPPMSMKRRLGGCFLLLLLAVPPFLGICHALVLFSHSRNVVERLVLCLVYLVMFLGGTHFLAREAQHSRVGMLLRADVVPVDDVASYIDQCSANVALKINFNARKRRGHLGIAWPYDHHEDASPPSGDVVAHLSRLSSTYEVVRLRLPVRAGLADKQTRGDFMTALHTFYLKTKKTYPSLTVEVLRQNHVVAITRTEGGLPRSFRTMQTIFSVSVYLNLSWIPRVIVLLFFPQWVDPAYSPVYFYRKMLVSRAAGI